MKIIVGHTNLDLDCIGSMVLARYIYPDHKPVLSRLVHPSARNLYNLYHYHLDFMPSSDIKGETVERVVIVDTRSFSRVKEYFDIIENEVRDIEIYDHHTSESNDFENAVVHEGDCGSNTTMIGMELITRRLSISHKDATIALTGIYADTGGFVHDTVCEDDFRVASYLLKNGAEIKLVNNFLKSLKEKYQLSLFHDILNTLVWQSIKGHQLIFSYYSMEKQAGGLAEVVEEIFNIENPDAIFGVFHFEKPDSTVIIARSQKSIIDLNEILKPFGGGGHAKAASALVKKEKGRVVFANLLKHLEDHLEHAVTAAQIMTKRVVTINENWSLLEASMFLEDVDLSGAPVLNDNNDLVGMLTLRDIMKGRKNNQMGGPVKGFMKMKLITCPPDATMREIEDLMFVNSIGHLPVLDQGTLAGIITRTDMLGFLQRK
jgi:tRNA nucleotidyltransferase (CCA-adding enzyme)